MVKKSCWSPQEAINDSTHDATRSGNVSAWSGSPTEAPPSAGVLSHALSGGQEVKAVKNCLEARAAGRYSLVLPLHPSPKVPGQAGAKVRERYDVGQDGKTEKCGHHLV